MLGSVKHIAEDAPKRRTQLVSSILGVVWFLMFIGGVYIDLWLSPLKAIMCAVVVKLINTKKPIVMLVTADFREPPSEGR
ncbi:MAG: hypothetical protein B6U76_02270 [Desulfurococcales archaeon ex4484_217_2]|nr:MAG: hypothetical protein B6U76_02270 [Desulfurococcales archaeon ex4484_217_2]